MKFSRLKNLLQPAKCLDTAEFKTIDSIKLGKDNPIIYILKNPTLVYIFIGTTLSHYQKCWLLLPSWYLYYWQRFPDIILQICLEGKVVYSYPWWRRLLDLNLMFCRNHLNYDIPSRCITKTDLCSVESCWYQYWRDWLVAYHDPRPYLRAPRYLLFVYFEKAEKVWVKRHNKVNIKNISFGNCPTKISFAFRTETDDVNSFGPQEKYLSVIIHRLLQI